MTTTIESNIKEGYKNTPVGIIPKDWKIKKLNEIAKNKGLIRGPFGGALKKEIFKESGYKVYQQQNAIYSDIEIGDYYIDEEKFKELKRFAVQKNDFIVSCSGTIGKIFRIPNNYYEGIINQALLLIRLNDEKVNYSYFNFIFISDVIQRKILESQGGAMKNLVGMNQIRKIQLPIPPLPEQKAIADCLTTWDKGIEKLTQLIASKKEQKKGLMQQLLTGKKRLEGFEEEWREVRLEQVAKIVMGVSPSSKNYNDEKQGKFLIQGNADIKNRVSSPRQYTSEITKECSVGDILMSVRAPVGEISKSIHNACIGRGICAIQNNEYSTSDFLYYYLVYNEVLWNRLKQGSTFESVNSSDIRNFILTIPLINEQNAIAKVLTTADKEIELLEKKLETFKTQKKGLMQVLLTGTLRLCSGTNG